MSVACQPTPQSRAPSVPTATSGSTGSTTADLGGWGDLDVDVAAQRTGGVVAVTGSTEVRIDSQTVAMGGSFTRPGATTLYTLTGSASLRLGSYDTTTAGFELDNDGLTSSLVVRAGSTHFSGQASYYDNGGYWMSGSGDIGIAGGTSRGSMTFTNCTSSACTSVGSTGLDISVSQTKWGRTFTIDGNVRSNGTFRLTASANGNGYAVKPYTMGLIDTQIRAQGAYTVTMTATQSSLSLAVSGDAAVDWRGRVIDGWGPWVDCCDVAYEIDSSSVFVSATVNGYEVGRIDL